MRKPESGTLDGALSLKVIAAGIAALLLAGCSDSVERFSQNYQNPSDGDPVYTASIHKPKFKYAAPTYAAPAYQPPQMADAGQSIVQSPIANAPVARAPSYDYKSAYTKTYRQAPAVSAQAPIAPAPKYAFNAAKTPAYKAPVLEDRQVAAVESAPDASAAQPKLRKFKGGKITVSDGVTLYAIAKANHMSINRLADANGLSSPYTVAPGRVLIVPGVALPVVPAAIATAEPAAKNTETAITDQTPATPASALLATNPTGIYLVAKGDTLFSLGRKYNVSPFAIAAANNLPKDQSLPVGRKIKIPAATVSVMPSKAEQSVAMSKGDLAPAKGNRAPLALPNPDVAASTEQVADAPAAAVAAPDSAPAANVRMSMRWPVHGRVISPFGSKPNGQKNEGINITAPEGSNIQAAEGGVVAYAGNELKGYGNLVLIRHPGGYVTAYAHAASILVKKGDTVKRGDVIAKVGQTGAVQSPQLHFEVRKGATALDPTTFLNAATALN